MASRTLSSGAHRATRWLASTHACAFPPRDSTRVPRPKDPSRLKGAGNAGRAVRAHSLACKIKKHTSKSTAGRRFARHSPRNGFNGLLRALPGEPGFLATIAGHDA